MVESLALTETGQTPPFVCSDIIVFELREFKEKKKKNMDKLLWLCLENIFANIVLFWHLLKVKLTWNQK